MLAILLTLLYDTVCIDCHVFLCTAEYMKESNKVNIHFDGWTNNYDYVTSLDDPHLHPIGYMYENQDNLRGVNSNLQIPHSKSLTADTSQ